MYGYKSGYPLNALWGFQYEGVFHNVDEVYKNQITHSYVSQTSISEDNPNYHTLLGRAKYADVDKDGNLSIIEEFSVVTPAEKGSAAYKKMNAGDVFISAKINNGEVMVFTREYQLAHLLLSVRKGDVVTFVMRNSNGVEETVSIPFDKNEYFVEFA